MGRNLQVIAELARLGTLKIKIKKDLNSDPQLSHNYFTIFITSLLQGFCPLLLGDLETRLSQGAQELRRQRQGEGRREKAAWPDSLTFVF